MQEQNRKKATIIVTGASGFIGRHLLSVLKDDFTIFAIARRSPKAAGVQMHANINWIPLDVSDESSVKRAFEEIRKQTDVDYFIHLAGYYDFTYEDNTEYQATNVEGTRHVLEHARMFSLKHFMFASTLTITNFPARGERLNEDSPADADFPYALSKIKAEEFMKEYSQFFRCSVIRLAAIFSDWCEYSPLYHFLSTWLSRCWNCRILAGRGESSIPYLHIHDIVTFFQKMIRRSDTLPRFGIYIASPDDCSSHLDLFNISSRYYFGRTLQPHFMPRWLALIGVIMLYWGGWLIRRPPFERPWMIKYVDLKMPVDASRTRRILNWEPTPRYHIKRRLLFLIENMKSNPFEWVRINEAAMHKAVVDRPNFKIYQAMMTLKDRIVEDIISKMMAPENEKYFGTYQKLGPERLRTRIEMMCQLLEIAVRVGDRMHILRYAHNLAKERNIEGFYPDEVIYAVQCTGDSTVQALLSQPELRGMEQRIHDQIMMTIQLVTDEIEDTYEKLILEE